MSNTISDTLSSSEYVQHIYNTGEIPDTRPEFFDDILDKHVSNLEKWIRGGTNQPLAIVQARIKSVPALAALLDSSASQENEEESFEANFLEFKDLASLPKPEWLIYGILPTKGMNFLVAQPKKGKTYVAIAFSCTVALAPSGNDTLDALDAATLNWCGRATRHGHVIYIAAEDIDEVAQRVIGWAKYHHISDLPQFHFFKAPLHLATDTPRFMQAIDNRYAGADIKLVVIDTLAMCAMGIEENSKKEFDTIIASIEAIWRKYNCCVLVVHHAGRNGQIRGTSALDGVTYSLLEVRESDEQLVLQCNMIRRGKKFDDIFLDRQIVELGYLDEEGNPATTCVLTQSGFTPDSDSERLTKYQQNILNVAKAIGGVRIAKADLMKECRIDKSQERTFRRAIKALIHNGLFKEEQEKRQIFYTVIEAEQNKAESNEHLIVDTVDK